MGQVISTLGVRPEEEHVMRHNFNHMVQIEIILNHSIVVECAFLKKLVSRQMQDKDR